MTARENLARLAFASGLAIALLTGPTAASAAKEVTVVREVTPDGSLTQRVSHSDLDLTRASAVADLNKRVRRAVGNVCQPMVGRAMPLQYGQCTSTAWKSARPQMDQAIARAQQIASTGSSAIPAVAIVVSASE